ncbi:MAG: TlpA family protein disulfide reductase [Acidimicrobiales bacterium]
MATFIRRHDLGFMEHISDPEGHLRSALKVFGQPNWLFIDGETGEVERVVGALDEDGFRNKLESLAAA